MDDFIVAHSLRADGFDASEDGTGRGTPLIVGSLTSNGDAHSGFKDEGGLIAFNHQYGGDCRGLELRAVARSLQRDQGTAAVVGSTVRRLTPRECERLQGFPDDYTAVTYRGKPAADGPRYKALGNSMAVPVLRWILERIERLERPYDAQDDMTKSLAFAYSAIRARESSKPEHDRNYDFAKRELEPGEPVTDR
jgi:DNA (cytosine-5)-methyltransferase 1